MRPRVAGGHLASAMGTIAQEHEDDREAIAKLIAFAADVLGHFVAGDDVGLEPGSLAP